MKCLVFITTSAPATTIAAKIILGFRFHNATNCDNVAGDAGVDKIVFNFAVNRLWHLASIYVAHISVNFLDANPLEKARLSSVLFSVEDTRSAVCTHTAIRCLPLSVKKSERDM